jgi:probable 2-oxoglutarate dehydrogenase E1 component DHKTD1
VSSPTLNYDGAENPIKISLLPNPSHLGAFFTLACEVELANFFILEAVNPVALGKTRAKQFSLLKTSPEDCQLGDKVMCVQLHGDASFTGHGVVMESLGLSE